MGQSICNILYQRRYWKAYEMAGTSFLDVIIKLNEVVDTGKKVTRYYLKSGEKKGFTTQDHVHYGSVFFSFGRQRTINTARKLLRRQAKRCRQIFLKTIKLCMHKSSEEPHCGRGI